MSMFLKSMEYESFQCSYNHFRRHRANKPFRLMSADFLFSQKYRKHLGVSSIFCNFAPEHKSITL